MANDRLIMAVKKFAAVGQSLSEEDLERAWSWGDYNEGVRFAFFRTYEELRTIAAELVAERAQSGPGFTMAHRALASYQTAYQDLQAVLLGIDHETAHLSPGEGQWTLREVALHIIEAERAFFTVISYGLERLRSEAELPPRMAEAYWDSFWAGDPFAAIAKNGSFDELLSYYAELNPRIMAAFAPISEGELQSTAIFWESEPMPIQFRLFRFDSHLRQHTVQVEKTLVALERTPTEAQRLLRLIYQALAEVVGAVIGAREIGLDQIASVAEQITNRAEHINSLFI